MPGTPDGDMATMSPATHAGTTGEAAAKRRKLRKGTRSCWECKRRKTRCIFVSPDDVTCIGCQHRRAPCVTQDLPEDFCPPKKGSRHLKDRIERVEGLVNVYLSGTDAQERIILGRDGQGINGSNEQANIERTPSSSGTLLERDDRLGLSDPTPGSDDDSGPDYIEIARHHLWKALPNEHDTNLLLRECGTPALYTKLVNTQPHSMLTREALTIPPCPAQLPDRSYHPVIMAKYMLVFAITLQSPTGQQIVGLSESQTALKRRLFDAATTWVTTQPEMHGSLECLVCMILEAVFEINSGNLRRAWAVYRRAMTAAQLMGMHRSPTPALKRIDTRINADPEFIWFRIVYMDRYLSLLLGLPQGSADLSTGPQLDMQHEPPLGIFERQLTVIASRILDRNASPFTTADITRTLAIDADLLQISTSMPASFWRPVSFHGLTPGSPDTLLETVRLAAQVYYYSLLIQLHLPYVMAMCGHPAHDYPKTTCVNASREIISRFIVHRTFNPISSCSRPVDFFALLAGMALLLAHISAHDHHNKANTLAHQRLSDRAVLEQAVERMDVIREANNDPISAKSAKLIRQLLEIEADAARGNCYVTAREPAGADVEGHKDGPGLRLQIPYLGVIKIVPQGQAQSAQAAAHGVFTFPPHAAPMDLQTLASMQGASQGSGYGGIPMQDYPADGFQLQSPTASELEDWTLQGVDVAFFDSLMRGNSGADATVLEQGWQHEAHQAPGIEHRSS